MGLIKSAIAAVGGTLRDQWREYFYCDSLTPDTLVVRGQKKGSGRNRGDDNVISNGSGVVVAEGQCMMIVDSGRVVEVSAEPGEYTFDASSEPSVFSGDLGDAIMNTFRAIGRRISYGGDAARDQRVYYFNTKEIVENRFGTQNPIPFRVLDRNIGLDIDVSVRCSGIYSYRIADPLLFYSNVCGNVANAYRRSDIDAQLKTEFITALQPAFAKISETGVRPSALPAHAAELADAMNEALTKKWLETRGIAVVSVALNPITLPEEDAEMIKQAQRTAIMRDPSMAAATLATAQADAMRAAAANKGGAAVGFMGMNMASAQGGLDAASLYAMGSTGAANRGASPEPAADSWKCSCGAVNTGKFCAECGAKRPEAETWKCSCGAVNTGKFCSECGAKRPEAETWTCSCGAVNTGKFCSECGAKRP